MVVDRAVAAATCKGARATAYDGLAIGCRCAVLHGAEWLSVANAAEGFSALHDGTTVFLSVARQWLIAPDQPRAGDGRARARRP